MDIYLIDKDALGELADAILAQKFPGQDPHIPELAEWREYIMSMLNIRITERILNALPDEQLETLSSLIDQDVTDPLEYQKIFLAANLDTDQIVNTAVDQFRTELDEYLKGVSHE